MSTRNLLFGLGIALAFGAGAAIAQSPGLGKNISEADIAAWDIAVLPDGSNLPPGSGTPRKAPRSTRRNAPCATARKAAIRAPGYSPMVGAHKLAEYRLAQDHHLLRARHDDLRHHPPGDAVPDAADAHRR